jgi:hypothetical protein
VETATGHRDVLASGGSNWLIDLSLLNCPGYMRITEWG